MRVLLADDHALFRAGLVSLLNAWGVQMIGQAANGNEAIARARELHPDLVLMDINMPGLNGLEATRVIKTEFPDIKVIILTVSDDQEDLFEAIKSGAEGYLLKNLREEEFADLMNRIARGEPVMSSGLAKKLLQEFARLKQQEKPVVEAEAEIEAGLSVREQEVLELVARGDANKKVAATLHISGNTVNFHMKNILSKLHLKNRTQVAAWALRHGFTSGTAG